MRDGDYGLWLSGVHPLAEYVLARYCDGLWHVVYGDGGTTKTPHGLKWSDATTVFRLSGWGADGPTEAWTEPLPAVEVKVGMELAYVSDADSWDIDGCLVLTVNPDGSEPGGNSVQLYRSTHPSEPPYPHVYVRTPFEERLGRRRMCGYYELSRFRHYPSGAPLKLPQGTTNE